MTTSTSSVDRIALSAAVMIYAIGLLLVTVVLPARAGRDPLGTGALLGIVAEPTESGPLVATPAVAPGPATSMSAGHTPEGESFRSDRRTFVLEPGKGIEFKYGMDRGRAMLYSWVASAPVHYDFHGDPEGSRPGYADTYDKGDAGTAKHGTFVAPSKGIHGWYWENRGAARVTVTLEATGFFTTGIEFLPTGPVEHQIPAR